MNAPRRIVSGALYTLGTTYLGRLVTLLAGLWLLPRLIDPATWGGVVLGASLYLILISVKELGLGFALQHHQDRLDELAPTHFIFNLAVSTGVLGLVLLLAWGIHSGAVGLARLTVLVRDAGTVGDHRVVAWTLFCFAGFNLLRSAAATSEVRLRAALEFRSLALAHMLSLVLSVGVALALAWQGYGVWALIAGGAAHLSVHSPAYVGCTVAWIWKRQPQPLRGLRWNSEHAGLLWRYGRLFWAGWVFSALALEYPRIVAGSLLGWEELGYYAIAFGWAQLPTGAVTQVLMGLTNPVYARYQHNRERLSLVFGKMLRFIVRAAALLALVFFLEAERLIPLISGPQWGPAVELLRWLVVYALCRPFLDDVQALLLAVGRPGTVARINGIVAAATLVGIPVLVVAWGLRGIAIGAGGGALLGAVVSLVWVRRHVDVPWRAAFLSPALSMAATLAAVSLLADWAPPAGWPALIARLAIEVVTYGAALLILEGRELWAEAVDLRRILRQGERDGDG